MPPWALGVDFKWNSKSTLQISLISKRADMYCHHAVAIQSGYKPTEANPTTPGSCVPPPPVENFTLGHVALYTCLAR